MMFGSNPGTNKTWKMIPKNSVGAELGVWKGDSSAKFLKRAKHLHLVDSWSPAAYVESQEHGGYQSYLDRYSQLVDGKTTADFQKYYDAIYEMVVQRFNNKPVTIHRMTTAEFFNNFTEKLDWVYVDASHEYDGCLQDLHNAKKLIKSGGGLFGDDFRVDKPEVMKAVLQFSIDTKIKIDNFHQDQYRFDIP